MQPINCNNVNVIYIEGEARPDDGDEHSFSVTGLVLCHDVSEKVISALHSFSAGAESGMDNYRINHKEEVHHEEVFNVNE